MLKDKAQFWKDAKEVWDEITPVWMFRCRPDDFPSDCRSICPGVFWLPGLIGLLALHVACFVAFVANGFKHGYRSEFLIYLGPLALLWLVWVSADIKFRLQRPTKAQRSSFDNSVIDRFGLVITFAGYFIVIPALIISAVWNWLH